jgi:hypothetical protein
MDSDVEKTENSEVKAKSRGRWKLMAVLAVCAAPLIGSYFTYYVIKPKGGVTNYGTLIDPRAYPIPAMASTTLDGAPKTLDDYKGKWIMLKVGPSECLQDCQDQLFAMRQLRTMQGKGMERIERVWMITDDKPLDTVLMRVEDGTHMLRDRPAGQPDDALPQRRGLQRYREGQEGQQGHRQTAQGFGDRLRTCTPLSPKWPSRPC